MELHISAGSGCQQESHFNLSLFKVSVLDMLLCIQFKGTVLPSLSWWEYLASKYSPVQGLPCSAYVSFGKPQVLTSPVWWASHHSQNLPTDLSVFSLYMVKIWLYALNQRYCLFSVFVGLQCNCFHFPIGIKLDERHTCRNGIIKCLVNSFCNVSILMICSIC